MPTTATSTRGERTLPASSRGVIVTLLVATFVVILNETIMGVALPRLMTDLRVTASSAQWLTTAFMLTMAVVIPTTGFLLQRLSTRTVFHTAMGLFCLGTLMASLSPGFGLLVLARVVQASGTAIMLPLLMTTILTLVPVEHRGVVMGNVSIVISVAPAIGPTVSGLILQFLSWRFLFALVLPVAIAALVYGSRRLVNVGAAGTNTLDVASVVLSVPAFAGIVFGLSRIGEPGSDSRLAVAVGSLVLGLGCLGLFCWRQVALQSRGFPLLDLRVFGFRMFRLSTALLCLVMMALFGSFILLPIYLQSVRGLDSLQTGLVLFPGGLLMGLLAPTVGRIFDRYGPRALTTGGAAVMTVVLWRFAVLDAGTPVWVIVGLHLALSLALACLFTPAFTSGLNPLPPQLYSHGSATMTTLQQVAGAAGTALLVAIMTGRTAALRSQGLPTSAAQTAGLQAAFGAAVVIGVVTVVIAAFLRTPRQRHV